MQTLSPIFLLIPIIVVAACIGFFICVIAGRRQLIAFGPVRQIVHLSLGLLLFWVLGCISVAPTGAGSGIPAFLAPIIPCILFIMTGPRFTRILALLATCACLFGVISEYREGQRFTEHMKLRYEAQKREVKAQQTGNTEYGAADLGVRQKK